MYIAIAFQEIKSSIFWERSRLLNMIPCSLNQCTEYFNLIPVCQKRRQRKVVLVLYGWHSCIHKNLNSICIVLVMLMLCVKFGSDVGYAKNLMHKKYTTTSAHKTLLLSKFHIKTKESRNFKICLSCLCRL